MSNKIRLDSGSMRYNKKKWNSGYAIFFYKTRLKCYRSGAINKSKGEYNMTGLTKEIIDMLEQAPFAILSTATPEGIPNAVPIGAKKILDSKTILLSDQFFNKTLANMNANPRVSLTFWLDHAGYQVKGSVTIETTGPRYEETVKWIEEMGKKMGVPLASKGAVILNVEEVYSIGGPDSGRRLI